MTNDLAFLAAAHNAATLIKQWFVFKLSLMVDFYWQSHGQLAASMGPHTIITQ